jgi:hypothetical protein
MHRFFIVLLVTCIYSFSSHAYWEYQVSVDYESSHFVFERAQNSLNDQETLSAAFMLRYDNEDWFHLYIEPQFKVDFIDHSRDRYLPNRAYIKFYGEKLSFKAGVDVNRWGFSEFFRPTDVLNRFDLEDNYFAPGKLGEALLEINYSPRIQFLDAFKLSLKAFPLFQESPLPDNNTRFALAGSQNGINYQLIEPQERPDFLRGVGGAISIDATIKKTDLQLVYYHGPEHQPGYYLTIDNNGALRLGSFYYSVDMIGASVLTTAGSFTFLAEGAYKTMASNTAKTHDISPVQDNAIPNDYGQVVAGGNYVFYEAFHKADIKLMVEYMHEFSSSDAFQNFRAFDHDVMLGLQLTLNDSRDTYLTLGLFKDVLNQELVFYQDLSSKVYKDFRLGVKSFWLRRDSGNTPFAQFANNSFVSGYLEYRFGKRHETTP